MRIAVFLFGLVMFTSCQSKVNFVWTIKDAVITGILGLIILFTILSLMYALIVDTYRAIKLKIKRTNPTTNANS